MKKETKNISIDLYSVEGKLINTIYTGAASAFQQINYSTVTLADGIYFVKMNVNGGQQTIKYVVVK